jgi:hypothetical protein
MLNRDLARYVDQQRSLGFKFRLQNILLKGFVAFAEKRGDTSRALVSLPGPERHHRQSSVGTDYLRFDALHWQCMPRMGVIRFQRPMRSGAQRSSADHLTSIVPMRSCDYFELQRLSSPRVLSDQ